jgi:hypothetical protein
MLCEAVERAEERRKRWGAWAESGGWQVGKRFDPRDLGGGAASQKPCV